MRLITEALFSCGELVKNHKLWLFYVVKNKLDYPTALKLGRQWGVQLVDVRMLPLLTTQTMSYLRRLAKKFPALTLEKFDEAIVAIMRDTKVWLGKFVSKKLRFIVESQGLHRDDIEFELLSKGIQGLMVMYPCVETFLHATNVVKRVMHNQGINLIYHYTTQKAGRLTKDGSGSFHSRVIALQDGYMKFEIDHDPELRMDFGLAIHRYEGKRRQFLELLSGVYSAEFTAFLVSNGHKVESNEDLLGRSDVDKYIRLALEYLEVSVESGQKFLCSLRAQFLDHAIDR